MHFSSFCRDADTVNENSVSAMWILYCREKYNAATGCHSVIYLGEFSLLFMATFFKQLSWPLVVRHAQHAVQQFATPKIKLFSTFHAAVVDIVPPTAAISGYTIGLSKLSADWQTFYWCTGGSKFLTTQKTQIISGCISHIIAYTKDCLNLDETHFLPTAHASNILWASVLCLTVLVPETFDRFYGQQSIRLAGTD